MDLRNLPENLSAKQECDKRRGIIERELGTDLSNLGINENQLGDANIRNCENMFGHVPLPVGLAGPLEVHFSSDVKTTVHLPLATTEGALVASVNRGCKAISTSGGVQTSSTKIGISRSIAFKILEGKNLEEIQKSIENSVSEWKTVGESTSNHLKIVNQIIDHSEDHLFLTLYADTDEAMGMNMITIAAQAIGHWIENNIDGLSFITVAGNVDSDKKPSARTCEVGRGWRVTAEALIPSSIIEGILKTTPVHLLAVANAKLNHGSKVAGALAPNLHAANIIAALYLAIGQDAAHTVEGSLTNTRIESVDDGIRISIDASAIIIGVRGGGTGLPAQNQALSLTLLPETSLHPCQQLAETVGAAILAGELSLLAAQASHDLANAHGELGR